MKLDGLKSIFKVYNKESDLKSSMYFLYLSCISRNYHNLTFEFKGKMSGCLFCSSKKGEAKFSQKVSLRNGSTISMAYTSYKQTTPKNISFAPIVIMHGLLGSKQNWKTLGKLINEKTGRTVYTIDARNHGESPHSSEFDYYKLGEDILYFLRERSIPKACLIGHSMGGRAVMTVALHNPSVVEKLFVVDISPIGTAEAISPTRKFVEIMSCANIPGNLELHEGRKYVDKLLKPVVSEESVRMFLLQNLKKNGNQFTWKVNLDAIARNFSPHITTFPPAKDGTPFYGETYFIGGSLSDYIKPSDHDRIKVLFPNAKFSYIEGAGHWLHAEKPKEFIEEITSRLM